MRVVLLEENKYYFHGQGDELPLKIRNNWISHKLWNIWIS